MQALKKTKSSQQMKKPQMSSEAFPALSASAAPTAPPQWIKIAKSKEKPKPAKTPSPPKEPNFNPAADFPGLPVNNKQKPKKVAAAPQIASMPSSQYAVSSVGAAGTKSAKKEKKKNNTKKENVADDIDFSFADDRQLVREARDASASQVLANMNNNQTVSVNEQKLKTLEQPVPEKNRNGGNGDFALKAKDYPALGGNATKPVPTKTPAKTMATMASKPVANGVPPGFSKPRPPCDGMTFTNSSGQQFSAPLHSYIPPPAFESRNHALVKKFAVALGGTEAFEGFKVASRAFRDSMISADDFYQHCQSALGSKLDDVFPELVALLPDIAKQQELVVGRKAGSQLDVCSVCGQLLAPTDRVTHDTIHWPPLSGR